MEIEHISETASRAVREGKLSFRRPVAVAKADTAGNANKRMVVTWHDPCHIGRHGGIYEAPREVLAAIPGLELREMEHNRENGFCCGSVLTRVGEVSTSDRLGGLRVREAEATGAEALITTCPCCEFQLRVAAKSNGSNLPVVDFASIVAQALGYETQDPTDEVHYMWSVFERAIYQMSLAGMVEMMRELMPSLMNAMPDVMQGMMEVLRKTPAGARSAAVAAMRPLLPRMMPRMMPAMMPKMLPLVQEFMERQIPAMPASMRAALPDILPYVMDQLMPKAMPKLLPIIAPDMVEAMRQRLGLTPTSASGTGLSSGRA